MVWRFLLNKFQAGQTVWFYCNPDNLYDPLREGCVFEGVITEIKEETINKTTLDGKTKETNTKYEVEVGWECHHPKEEEMFHAEQEAKEYATKIMSSRIGKINERLELFVKLLEKLNVKD